MQSVHSSGAVPADADGVIAVRVGWAPLVDAMAMGVSVSGVVGIAAAWAWVVVVGDIGKLWVLRGVSGTGERRAVDSPTVTFM